MSTNIPDVMDWCIENENVGLGAHLKWINAPDETIAQLRVEAGKYYLRGFDCDFVAGAKAHSFPDVAHVVFSELFSCQTHVASNFSETR